MQSICYWYALVPSWSAFLFYELLSHFYYKIKYCSYFIGDEIEVDKQNFQFNTKPIDIWSVYLVQGPLLGPSGNIKVSDLTGMEHTDLVQVTR